MARWLPNTPDQELNKKRLNFVICIQCEINKAKDYSFTLLPKTVNCKNNYFFKARSVERNKFLLNLKKSTFHSADGNNKANSTLKNKGGC